MKRDPIRRGRKRSDFCWRGGKGLEIKVEKVGNEGGVTIVGNGSGKTYLSGTLD